MKTHVVLKAGLRRHVEVAVDHLAALRWILDDHVSASVYRVGV